MARYSAEFVFHGIINENLENLAATTSTDRKVDFAIERCRRELLGRLVARHLAVFLFLSCDLQTLKTHVSDRFQAIVDTSKYTKSNDVSKESISNF